MFWGLWFVCLFGCLRRFLWLGFGGGFGFSFLSWFWRFCGPFSLFPWSLTSLDLECQLVDIQMFRRLITTDDTLNFLRYFRKYLLESPHCMIWGVGCGRLRLVLACFVGVFAGFLAAVVRFLFFCSPCLIQLCSLCLSISPAIMGSIAFH